MVLFRGIADDLRLMDWLQKFIFPAEKKNVTAAFVKAGTRLAALEMIRSGTTTFADMYYFEDQVAEAAKEAGLRVVAGETLIEFPAPDNPTTKDDARLRRAVPGALEGRPAGHGRGGAALDLPHEPRDHPAPRARWPTSTARRCSSTSPSPPTSSGRCGSATARRRPSTCATWASCARAWWARTACG